MIRNTVTASSFTSIQNFKRFLKPKTWWQNLSTEKTDFHAPFVQKKLGKSQKQISLFKRFLIL